MEGEVGWIESFKSCHPSQLNHPSLLGWLQHISLSKKVFFLKLLGVLINSGHGTRCPWCLSPWRWMTRGIRVIWIDCLGLIYSFKSCRIGWLCCLAKKNCLTGPRCLGQILFSCSISRVFGLSASPTSGVFDPSSAPLQRFARIFSFAISPFLCHEVQETRNLDLNSTSKVGSMSSMRSKSTKIILLWHGRHHARPYHHHPCRDSWVLSKA